VLLCLASLGATLLVLEVLARLALRSEGPDVGTEFTEYTEWDPLLGWHKRPLSQLTFRRREYTVDIAINSHGLRDPERDYAASPGTSRILALGDSFVEGYTVPLANTLTQVLEASLRRSGCSTEAINGGTSGYSTDQEVLFYESEGARYSPRVVVLFFYYNDVLYNDRQSYNGAPKPIFVIRDGELRLYKSPISKPNPTRKGGGAPASPRLASLRWLQDRLWFGAPRLYNVLGRLGLWAPNRPLGARMELRVYDVRTIPEIEQAWIKTAELLKRLSKDVAAHEARLLLVYVPSQMEVNERAWTLSRSLYGIKEGAWDRGLVLRRLQGIGQEVGFPVLDLTGPLRAADRGGRSAYYERDGHWNALGHEIAAREVEGFLRARGWASPCP
jgi:hypothetical protein